MIWRLMRRDRALKLVPDAVISTLVIGFFFGGAESWILLDLAAAVFLFAVIFTSSVQIAATQSLALLPIDARDVYAARVFVLESLILSTLAAASPWIRGIAPVEFAAAASLLAVIVPTLAISNRPVLVIVYFSILPLLSLSPLLARLSPEWFEGEKGIALTVCFFLTTAGIFLWRRSTMPRTLLTMTIRSRARPPRGGPWTYSSVSPWAALRAFYPWQYVLWTVVLFMEATTLGLGAFAFIAFAWMVIWQSTQWILALPVSRSRLLPVLLFPVAAAFLAGSATRDIIPWYQPRVVHTDTVGCVSRQTPTPPLEYWSLTPVRAESPWGEAIDARATSRFGRRVFNPYQIDCLSSARFVKWQNARAKAAILNRRPQRRLMFLHIAMLLSLTFFAVILSVVYYWYRIQWIPPLWRKSTIVVAALCWTVAFFAPVAGIFYDSWQRFNFNDFSVALSWELPGLSLTVALIPVVLLYLAADRLFREAEVASVKAAPVL